MYKRSIQLLPLLLLGFVNVSMAGSWSSVGKVTEINQQPGAGNSPFPESVYFRLSESTASTCTDDTAYYLDAEGEHMNRLFSLLLTAYTANKNIKVYSDGTCSSWNAAKVDGIVLSN